MDPATGIGSVLAAFGLAAAAGLNPFLPVLLSALLARLDVVELAGPFEDLQATGWLVGLAVLTVADLVADKVPAVDSVLHAVGTVVAPVSGAVLFTGQADAPELTSIVLGALTALGVHVERAAVRPLATATTGGLANPVLSLLEDLGAVGLVVLAFVLPVLAALIALGAVVAGVLVVGRLRGSSARRAA